MRKWTLLFIGGMLSGLIGLAQPYVIVFGVDGMSPLGIEKADTPNMDYLVEKGTHTFSAKAVLPTSSSPNWASMISGAKPEHHGVKSNAWKPGSYDIELACKDRSGRFPTIFTVLRNHDSEANIACFYDWKGFGRLADANMTTTYVHSKNEDKTIRMAKEYIGAEKPNFLFIHVDHVDHALHGKGFNSKGYVQAIEKADQLLGEVIEALKEAGLWDECFLLVTADHGGKGRRHGGDSEQEVNVPWVIHGPTIRKGFTITNTVNTYDTAATIAHIFGAERPDCWIGKPIVEAFSRQ